MKTTMKRVVELVALVLVLLLFVPMSVGGAASYVRVRGSSMYPTLRSGDTVLLVRDDHYEVGDIVAYRSEQLGGAVVIHRIIHSEPDGTYVTQGDHNNFVDAFHPSNTDILGKRMARIPGGNAVVTTLQGPTGAAILVAGLWLLLFFRPQSRAASRRRRAMRGRT